MVFNTFDVNTFTVSAKYICCLVVKHYITTMKRYIIKCEIKKNSNDIAVNRRHRSMYTL